MQEIDHSANPFPGLRPFESNGDAPFLRTRRPKRRIAPAVEADTFSRGRRHIRQWKIFPRTRRTAARFARWINGERRFRLAHCDISSG